MSDLGLLSHQYQELTHLSRQLKEAAVQIRRAYLNLPPSEPLDERLSLDAALTRLKRVACFLQDVIGWEDEGAWPAHWFTDLPLPTRIVEQLREAHTYDLPLYIKQLARLADHLQQGVSSLSDTDLEVMDGIVLALGADANAVFRRMMRWA